MSELHLTVPCHIQASFRCALVVQPELPHGEKHIHMSVLKGSLYYIGRLVSLDELPSAIGHEVGVHTSMERFHSKGPGSSILRANPLGEPQGSNWPHASVEASQRVSSQPLSNVRGNPLSHDALGLQY
jgi:hypothetical protein